MTRIEAMSDNACCPIDNNRIARDRRGRATVPKGRLHVLDRRLTTRPHSPR